VTGIPSALVDRTPAGPWPSHAMKAQVCPRDNPSQFRVYCTVLYKSLTQVTGIPIRVVTRTPGDPGPRTP